MDQKEAHTFAIFFINARSELTDYAEVFLSLREILLSYVQRLELYTGWIQTNK